MKKDIMQDLLGGSEFDSIPGLEELNSLMRLCADPPDSPPLQSSKEKQSYKDSAFSAEDFPDKSWKNILKKKVSFLVSENNLNNLNKITENLKHIVNVPGFRISKSVIIDQALHVIIKDFDEKGEQSSLVQRLFHESSKL